MLLNDWMSSLAGSYKRKRNTCSGLSRNRRRSARPRRQLQPCLIFSQPELLEDRVLLAATNPLDLATLDGTTGFRLDGIDADDWSGRSVSSAGDVNGDGFDDLIIGAFNADPNGGDSGETYVVFGKSGGFSAAVDLATLDGTTGFRLNGIVTRDHSGASVSSAGDVNGDGFDDLIIGAVSADPNGGDSGESYVVFGKSGGFAAAVDLSTLDGTIGFRLEGIEERDWSGASVSSAGDVNGDGFDDLIIGARFANHGGNLQAGESYVVFGKSGGFSSAVNLSTLDGTTGFRLDGINISDSSGVSVSSAGDVNGDGFDDVIIGALHADPGGDSSAGESYVVFGKSGGFNSAVNLSTLDGTIGFRLDGIDADDISGTSVSSAGDVNGDGFDDVIIGAFKADPGGDSWAGESYVVFGKSGGFSSAVDLAALDGTTGFQVDGIDADDISGASVSSAGDVNGDGFDDLIIGAFHADPGGDSKAGESYVVFGGNFTGSVETHVGDATANTLAATQGASTIDILIGAQGNDTLIGDGGADVLYGGEGDDTLAIVSSAFQRVAGGNGSDTLRLNGAGLTLDLTTIADNKVIDIEVIDISGSGPNTLTLDFQEVINISSSSNTLAVRHDSGDTINIGDGWAQTSRRTVESIAYEVFTQGAAELLIEDIAPKVSQSFPLPDGGGEYLVARSASGVALEIRQILLSSSTLITFPLDQLGNLTINGSSSTDRVTLGTLDGYTGTIIFNAGAGHDVFDASATAIDTNVQGGAGNDRFLGGSGIDRFVGGDGSDSASGGGGNDSLIGNSGDDTLRGDAGNDFLNGNAGRDVLTGNDGNDTVFGGSGTDTLDGGSGADFVNGQGGRADIVAGGGGADTLRGGASDVIIPGSADTVPSPPTTPGDGSTQIVTLPVTGGPFTVLIDGDRLKITSASETVSDVPLLGTSDVSIIGSDGDDSVTFDASLATLIGSVTLNGGDGNDSFDTSAVSILTLFVGGAGNDTLTGGDGRDIFLGGDGDDSASGGAGNDVLNGNGGKDSLFGGDGDDQLLGGRDTDFLDGGNGSDAVNGQSGRGDIVAGGGGGIDTLRGDSSDTLIDGPSGIVPGTVEPGGAVSNGVLTVALPMTGGSFNVLVAAGQIQVVPAGGGTPLVDEVFAGITDIVINGGAGNDAVVIDATLTAIVETVAFYGFGGDDSLDSGSSAANVVFNGGDGDDTLIGGSGNDVANGGAGDDSITTGAGTDRIDAGVGDDFVDAGTDADTVFGEAGQDVLIGGAGTDRIDAGIGDDFVDAGTDADTVFGGAGRDVLIGGTGNDFLNGNGGRDTISGGDDDDTLLGGSNRDSLDGGLGNDIVRGQGGNHDIVIGGGGIDIVAP